MKLHRDLYLPIVLSIFTLLSYSDVSGQCYPDRHSTRFQDAWLSCTQSTDPVNGSMAHWIQYDFGVINHLTGVQLWNYNSRKDELDNGVLELEIISSKYGTSWTLPDTLTLDVASGYDSYQGQGFRLSKRYARYVHIRVISTHGSTGCAGLSHIRFFNQKGKFDEQLDDASSEQCLSVTVVPNPLQETGTIKVNTSCDEAISYEIWSPIGGLVNQGTIITTGGRGQVELNDWKQPAGTYFLIVRQAGQTKSTKFIKTK